MSGYLLPQKLSAAETTTLRTACEVSNAQTIHRILEPKPPLHNFRNWQDRLLLGRAAYHVFAPRLADSLVLRAWRSQPRRVETIIPTGQLMLRNQQCWRTWQILQTLSGADLSTVDEASVAILHAELYTALRDFYFARSQLKTAHDLSPDNPQLLVATSRLYYTEDAIDRALDQLDQCLHRHPQFLPALQWKAALLHRCNRSDEALSLLLEAQLQLSSASIHSQLFELLLDLRLYAQAFATCELILSDFPLMETSARRYYLQQHARLKTKMNSAPTHGQTGSGSCSPQSHPKRVELPVPFILQQFQTCAPATIAMISAYHGQPLDHLQMAAEITDDGTPDSAEREWLETNGWLVRECTFTQNNVERCINAGLPLAATTLTVNSAHMQAVVGYIPENKKILVRDPNDKRLVHWNYQQAFHTPDAATQRCLVIVPVEKERTLRSLQLDDGFLWDRRFLIRKALRAHQADTAASELKQLRAISPSHPVTLDAALSYALYHGNRTQALDLYHALLEHFPLSCRFAYGCYRMLNALGQQAQAQQFVAQLNPQVARHPEMLRLLAAQPHNHSRHRLRQLTGRYLRHSQHAGAAYAAAYDMLQAVALPGEELFMKRAASTLAPHNEQYAQDYFQAARLQQQESSALDYLYARTRSPDRHSAQALQTYYQALLHLERFASASEVLQQIARLDDSESRLFFAVESALCGEHNSAWQMLESCKSQVHATAWEQAAKKVATATADLATVLDLNIRRYHRQPEVPALLYPVLAIASSLGKDRFIDSFLQQQLEQFPDHTHLLKAWLNRLRTQDRDLYLETLHTFLRIHPDSVFLLRELADHYLTLRQPEQATQYIQSALRKQPLDPLSHCLAGLIKVQHGQYNAACTYFKTSIELDVTTRAAIQSWIRCTPSNQEKESVLALIARQIEQQPDSGTAVPLYAQALADLNDELRLIEEIEALYTKRADLWQTWLALAEIYHHTENISSASNLLHTAIRQFPITPMLYQQLAWIYSEQADHERAAATLHDGLGLMPEWLNGRIAYINCCIKLGKLHQAIFWTERSLRQHPFHSDLLALQAQLNGESPVENETAQPPADDSP